MTFLPTALVVALLIATPHAQPAITASDAWAPAASGAPAPVYMVINNPTMYDIHVVSAKSEAAGKVELIDGDKPVKELTVASYGSLELKAGGAFVRLSDLKQELKAGTSLTVTLMTDGGVTIVATASVK